MKGKSRQDCQAARRFHSWRGAGSFFRKMFANPLTTSAILLAILAPLVIILSMSRLYDENGIRTILAEAHGALFDILIFGVLVVLINKMGERRTEIKRYRENIFDCRYWDSPEAIIRTASNIRRLNDLGCSQVDLNFHNLFKANLHNTNLRGSKIIEANLGLASLSNSDVSEVNLEGTILVGTELVDADLRNSRLVECDLRGADFANANLENVDLSGANLLGAKRLKLEQLKTVAALYGASLDPHLLEGLQEECPEKLVDRGGHYRVNDLELFDRWKKNKEKVSQQYKEHVG